MVEVEVCSQGSPACTISLHKISQQVSGSVTMWTLSVCHVGWMVSWRAVGPSVVQNFLRGSKVTHPCSYRPVVCFGIMYTLSRMYRLNGRNVNLWTGEYVLIRRSSNTGTGENVKRTGVSAFTRRAAPYRGARNRVYHQHCPCCFREFFP